MKIWWCQEHNASVSFDDDLPTECYGCPYTALGYPESACRMVPMRLIPDNEETVERIADVIYASGWGLRSDARERAVKVLAALDGASE